MSEPRHLVLIGMMGSGKTTVGQLCADALGRPFVDTDDVVVELAGATIPELFEQGEAVFRRHERAAVDIAMQSPEPLVIACGGGVILDAANRAALRALGTVVWLTARPEVLVTRVGNGHDRPLLSGEPAASLRRLLTLREPAYSETAEIVVDGEPEPDVVAEHVLAALACRD